MHKKYIVYTFIMLFYFLTVKAMEIQAPDNSSNKFHTLVAQLCAQSDAYISTKLDGEPRVIITKELVEGVMVYEINEKKASGVTQLYAKTVGKPQQLELASFCEFCIPKSNSHTVHVQYLKTHKFYRGSGYASTLLRAVEQAAKEANYTGITLESFEKLQPFYNKRGYENTPTCKHSMYWTLIPMHKNL